MKQWGFVQKISSTEHVIFHSFAIRSWGALKIYLNYCVGREWSWSTWYWRFNQGRTKHHCLVLVEAKSLFINLDRFWDDFIQVNSSSTDMLKPLYMDWDVDDFLIGWLWLFKYVVISSCERLFYSVPIQVIGLDTDAKMIHDNSSIRCPELPLYYHVSCDFLHDTIKLLTDNFPCFERQSAEEHAEEIFWLVLPEVVEHIIMVKNQPIRDRAVQHMSCEPAHYSELLEYSFRRESGIIQFKIKIIIWCQKWVTYTSAIRCNKQLALVDARCSKEMRITLSDAGIWFVCAEFAWMDLLFNPSIPFYR